MQKISPKTISIVFSVLVVFFAIGSYIYGIWTEPTTTPPGSNVAAPINVSSVDQTKQGGLTLTESDDDTVLTLGRQGGTFPTNFRQGVDNALIINNNNSDILTIKSGNVGIGTTNPGTNKLDVAGNIHASGDICTDQGGGKCLSTSGGSGVIWEGSLSIGANWRCVDVPEGQCTGKGCFLKFKTIYSDGSIYAYHGTLDYDSATKWASFSSEADSTRLWRWNLNNGAYDGSWAHTNLLWLGDCLLTSSGSCTAGTYDNLRLCSKKYNLEAFLLKY